MTSTDELVHSLRQPGAVHVGATPELARRLLAAAQDLGFDCHFLDMSTVTDENYYAVLGQEFQFPTPAVNDHGAMDWISDLEWLGEFPGHLFVVDGLEQLLAKHDNVFRALVYILPQVIDRMRSGDEIFHAVLVGTSTAVINTALSELEEANARLGDPEAAARVANPSQPAPIIRYNQNR